MNSYFIHWKSTATGQTGNGTLRFEKEKAEEICRELNFDFPAIVHEAVLLVNEAAKDSQSKDAEQNQSHDPPPAPNERKSAVRNKTANRRQNEQHPE